MELQAGEVGVEQQPWILCRAGEAFTNSRLFLHLGLSGLTWELVLPLFRDEIRFMRLARLQQKQDRKGNHCKAVLGSKAWTDVPVDAKFPSVRFYIAQCSFVPGEPSCISFLTPPFFYIYILKHDFFLSGLSMP